MAGITKEEMKWLLQSYKTVFSSDMGKTVLEDLARTCFANRSTVAADAGQMYFNEGRRSVYLQIKRLLEIEDVEAYLSRYDQPAPEGAE